MRKNGVNRELRPIDGGVCAVEGFQANAVYCGIAEDCEPNGKYDLALIVSEKRCPTAAVYSTNAFVGAPVTVTKRHLKSGYARAVIVNSGYANVFIPKGEEFAESVCALLEKNSNIDAKEVVIASTGIVGKNLSLQAFEKGIPHLVQGLAATHENSEKAARAIMTTDTVFKQLSYSFDLGDFPCRIGAIFKGCQRVAPNMATVLGFITTDVNVSPEMLRKAFSSAVKDSFNLLETDGTSSPNDTLCIMSNGRAGNCRIDAADSEYEKFCYALHGVLTEMCRRIAMDAKGGTKLFSCKSRGARSKQLSRSIARAVVSSLGLKTALGRNELDMEALLFTVSNIGEGIDLSRLQISVYSKNGKLVLYEDGATLSIQKEVVYKTLDTDEVEITVDLGMGNYSSVAFGCDLTATSMQ